MIKTSPEEKMKIPNNINMCKRIIPWSQIWQGAVFGLIEEKNQ